MKRLLLFLFPLVVFVACQADQDAVRFALLDLSEVVIVKYEKPTVVDATGYFIQTAAGEVVFSFEGDQGRVDQVILQHAQISLKH